MASTDSIYIIDYINLNVIEKINIEYLDINAIPFNHAMDNSRFSYLKHVKQHYKSILDNYGIDSTENVMIAIIEMIKNYDLNVSFGLWPYEVEMLNAKKHIWGCYSRGDFFYEISELVHEAFFNKNIILKLLNGIEKMKYVVCEPSTDDCMFCFKNIILTIINLEITNESSIAEYITLVAYTLKAFSYSEIIVTRILQLPNVFLSFLLSCARLERFNFCGIFQENDASAYPLFSTLCSENLSNFVILLNSGAKNVTTSEIHELYLLDLKNSLKFLECSDMSQLNKLLDVKRSNFLLLQVLLLYLQCEKITYYLPTHALIELWKSITDPFLTEWDFMRLGLCKHTSDFFRNCWQWYYKNVCQNLSEIKFLTRNKNATKVLKPTYFKTPRSLKHLARCAVKNCCASNFCMISQLKWGIDFPIDLKDYL